MRQNSEGRSQAALKNGGFSPNTKRDRRRSSGKIRRSREIKRDRERSRDQERQREIKRDKEKQKERGKERGKEKLDKKGKEGQIKRNLLTTECE